MAEPILKVENLEAGYGEVQVLWGISLGVEAGQLTTIIGANGAGKTTTLRASMGIINPKAGRIILKGEDVTRWPPHAKADRGMVLVPEGRQLFANMTVRDNCTVGACFGRENLSLGQAREVADEVIEFLGLADRRDLLAAHLTIAGKKRLEVARALCARPMLLLLDEVLAGLNPFEIDQMIDIVRQIRDRGVSILIIEHLMQAIMSLSDRIVVLNFGEKLAEGRPQEVANDPVVVEAYLGDPDMAKKLERKR